MLLTHSHSSTSIIISESFAKKMQWLNTGIRSRYETTLGPNFVVTAKLTVNKQTVTQRLGQVHYAPDGLQRYCFTPPQ